MRSFMLAAVLGLGLGFAPEQAQAQIYFGQPYYPQTYFYPQAPPIYYAPPVYYQPPYVWSSQYYVNPYGAGWYRERYYPWTNSYFYQYQNFIRPYPVPWWYAIPR